MAITTKIQWTKSVFNSWVGCTKIGPGCDGCYAEALDKRHKWGGHTHWGAGVPRYRTSAANWATPLAWNKAAPDSEFAGRKGFWPVFCASLADVFDNEVPEGWRADLFDLIDRTPNLTWLLLTKRIGNARFVPKNVWLGASVVNQAEADRDIPKLLATPATKRFVSYEPAIGPINFSPWLYNANVICLDQIIVGGESSQPGHPARPFNIEWARSTVQHCRAAGVPVFMKQLGSHVAYWPEGSVNEDTGRVYWRVRLKDRAGADPSEWPADIRAREFPE